MNFKIKNFKFPKLPKKDKQRKLKLPKFFKSSKKDKQKKEKRKIFKFPKFLKSSKKDNSETLKVTGINRKMTISITSILTGLIIILGFVAYFISSNALIDSSKEMLLNKTIDSANLVNEQIKSYANSIETLGILEVIGDPEVSKKEKLNVLSKERVSLKFNTIGFSDTEGNLVLDNGKEINISEEEYFKLAKSGKSYFSIPTKIMLQMI